MTDADPRMQRAELMTGVVVYVTATVGGALLVAPDRVGEFLGARDDTSLRLIGVADVVIAAGLIFSSRRSRWFLIRAAASAGTAACFIRLGRANQAPLAAGSGVALIGATVGDLVTARDFARGQ